MCMRYTSIYRYMLGARIRSWTKCFLSANVYCSFQKRKVRGVNVLLCFIDPRVVVVILSNTENSEYYHTP